MTMKTTFSVNPSEFETDCLAILVLDRSEKDASGNARSGDAEPVVSSGHRFSEGVVRGQPLIYISRRRGRLPSPAAIYSREAL